MSRVTAAFVCALCDPDNPRPASIMCSNNCGRYVCAVHAMPRKGPGSAMVCLECADALGLIEKPKPRQEPTPIVAIPGDSPAQPAATSASVPPQPKTRPVTPPAAAAASAAQAVETLVSESTEKAAEKVEPKPAEIVDHKPAPKFDPDATLAGLPAAAPKSTVVPAEEHSAVARQLVEPPPPPQSSETVVSQRGNTLQVPKVTATLGRPPQPLNGRPRLAQRATQATAGMDTQLILMAIGSVVLGIVGFVMILAALAG